MRIMLIYTILNYISDKVFKSSYTKFQLNVYIVS